MIKFLNRGTGSTRRAVDYVIADHDHDGKIRPTVVVRRGNPSIVADLGDSLTFAHRYRSAVIAWAPTDRPSEEQKEEVLRKFEELAFAGLEPDQYAWLAVDHGDHIHIIVPRVELRSGRSMNIAPPGWRNAYDPLRDYYNNRYGWRSPDIAANPHNARIKAIDPLNLPQQAKRAKEMIHAAAVAAIEDGIITDRATMREWMAEIGTIKREGADYISILVPGHNRALRMKGGIYAAEFGRTGGADTRKEAARGRDYGQDQRGDLGRLQEKIAQRAQYNQHRYARRDRSAERAINRDDEPAAGSDQQESRYDHQAGRPHEAGDKPVDGGIDRDRAGRRNLDGGGVVAGSPHTIQAGGGAHGTGHQTARHGLGADEQGASEKNQNQGGQVDGGERIRAALIASERAITASQRAAASSAAGIGDRKSSRPAGVSASDRSIAEELGRRRRQRRRQQFMAAIDRAIGQIGAAIARVRGAVERMIARQQVEQEHNKPTSSPSPSHDWGMTL